MNGVTQSLKHNNDAHAEALSDRLRKVHLALEKVCDPEIPPVNIVEMGMIADVRMEGETVIVDMTPTFAGCPALDMIRKDITTVLHEHGEKSVKVNVVYDPPWTTDRLRESARRKLKEFGLAPPGKCCPSGNLPSLDHIACPFCDSINTELESIFGPTLCRSIHYCHACLQSFEHFKTV